MVETDIINWNLCEKKFIRKVEIDIERINSIKKKALQRLERARETEITLENEKGGKSILLYTKDILC